jgi:tetratricopeptide (TPR) repeat protein
MPDDFESNFKEGLQFFQNKQFEKAVLKFKDATSLKSDSHEAHYYLGRSYLETGDLAQSIKELKISLQLNPKDADAHFDLGRIYFSRKQTKKALEEIGQAINLDPTNQLYASCIWGVFQEKKLFQEGILFFRNAIDKNPRNVWFHTLLGFMHEKNGSLDEALNEFKELINLEPQNPEHYHLVGSHLRKMGKTDEASEFLKNALKLFPDNKKLHLQDAQLILDTILDLSKKGQWDEVIERYKMILDYETQKFLNGDVTDSPSTWFLNALIKEKNMESIGIDLYLRLYPQYYGKTEIYSGLREFLESKKIDQEVIDDYLSSIRQGKNCSAIHLNLANELKSKDLHEIAIDEYRRGLCFEPELDWPHCSIGIILMLDLDDDDSAFEELQKGLTMDQDDPWFGFYHYHFAWLLFRRGEGDRGISHLHKGISLDPDDYCLASGEIGRMEYIEAEDFIKKAIEIIEGLIVEGLEVGSGYSEAVIDLAILYEEAGKFEQAEVEYRRGIKINPKSSYSHNSFANLLMKTNNVKEAISEYRQAIQYFSKDPQFYKNLADALIKDHQIDEARTVYGEAMLLFPGDKKITETYINQEIALKDRLRDNKVIEHTIQSEFKKYLSLSTAPSLEEDHGNAEIFKKIRDKDWGTIIKGLESHYVEFKQSLRWSEIGEIGKRESEYLAMRAIASFINSDGGILFIGVSDKGNIIGLLKDYFTLPKGKQNSDGFRLRLDELINEYLGKKYHSYITIEIINLEGKEICAVVVRKGSRWVYLKDKEKGEIFFIRAAGGSSQQLSPSDALDWTHTHWKPNR